MSVITEIRKTKQKWSLNPRGKAWSEDSNKFGQKMLEKMGWSRGKGLGAKENGVTEHIRPSFKNDTKGMGFKESDGQWTEHDVLFNSLLQSLSGSQEATETEIKISSLEKKSQSSKVRVHYKKFTRGKDLSRCSEKDLAQIFGKKSLKPTLPPEEEETKEPEASFALNAGSMVDYFMKKLPNFGKISSPKVESEEEESCVGFGFKTPEKKRKLSEDSVEGTPKKFKSGEEDQIGLSNPAFDPFFNGVGVQKHVLNTIKEEESEENAFENAGAKKKRNREEAFEEEVKNKENGSVEALPDCEEGRKKKKKIKGNDTAVENQNGDLENGSFEIKRKKKKSKDTIDNDSVRSDNFEVKRKKKDKEEMALDNPNFNDEIIVENGFADENFEVKRKDKKKKDKKENLMALDNPNFNDEITVKNGFVDENFEVKRKNKKKKGEMAIDNPNFNDENADESTFNNDFEVKRKKKKKKDKNNDSLAIDNPNFNDFDNSQTEEEKKESVQNEPEFDLMLNVTSTPCVKEEKSSKKVKRRKSVRFSDVNEERIIPNEDIQLRNELFDINTKVISNGLKQNGDGTSNLGFDKSEVILNENINELSRRIDGFQAEIENDMNEAKSKNQFGEKLPNGTKLNFKNVKFGRVPPWARSNDIPTAKKSYKHLIKEDIILAFNNTNLHEITGYGVNNVEI